MNQRRILEQPNHVNFGKMFDSSIKRQKKFEIRPNQKMPHKILNFFFFWNRCLATKLSTTYNTNFHYYGHSVLVRKNYLYFLFINGYKKQRQAGYPADYFCRIPGVLQISGRLPDIAVEKNIIIFFTHNTIRVGPLLYEKITYAK